jgi:hypothetical protein
MGQPRSTYGGEVNKWFWWGNLRKGEHFEDPGVGGIIILKCLSETWNGNTDWIDLAQDRDR